MQKIKPIAPSLREKKRYVVAEVITEKFDAKATQKAITDAHSMMYGAVGAAQAGILFLKDTHQNRVLLRVSAKSLEKLKNSLNYIKEIKGRPAIVRSVGVSGTLKKARERYMGEKKCKQTCRTK